MAINWLLKVDAEIADGEVASEQSKRKVTNMANLRRNYSRTTQRVLDIQSLNQCAYPGCTNTLIEPSAGKSDPVVIGHICHIHALNPGGPRWKEELSQEELNSPENLILLCPTHHAMVDGQPEYYMAETLRQWKREHEAKVQSRHPAGLDIIIELIDQKIKEETDILRKSRFFGEYDSVQSSFALARKLVEGELSGGTNVVKRESLAWCVRFLARTEKLDQAGEYLKIAKKLGACQEIDIADAFIFSQQGDKQAALSTLAKIDSPMSRSAALNIVAHHDGPQGAIDWLKKAGISDLDSDGKYFLLWYQFELEDWKGAQKSIDALTEDDLRDAPVLHHLTAITHLMSTVPVEFRTVVLRQLPLSVAHFPLASDADSIESRRVAHQHFIKTKKVAHELSLPHVATLADGYALWLELRDPDESDQGRKRLESTLRNPKTALNFVHLGVEFGIDLDIEAIEREIEREIALNGGLTLDAALARFALAFTQKSPEAIADYIARHYDELATHIDKKAMLYLQLVALTKSGQIEKANKCLATLIKDGLSEGEESRLQKIIAEAEGTDPVEGLKEQFKKTSSLSDLETLIPFLEERGDWDSLCEYGEILFEKTHDLRDAERFAFALRETQKKERLVAFLKANETPLAQSDKLQMLYCWSLYQTGMLLEARSALAELNGDWDDLNYRKLKIDLEISLGNWNALSEFVAKECQAKDERRARELIRTAQLALHWDVAKELIFAATEKGNDDADVLAEAYLLASNAGWEDDPRVFEWIQKAVELSGDDGPLWKVTPRELLDLEPDWNRSASEIWQQLSHGEISMFLVAIFLNRSLGDLMLFPALANPSEIDPRRRGAIPAYSGQRQPTPLNTGGQVGMDVTALLTLSLLNSLDKALDAFETVHLPHSTLHWLFHEKQRVAFHQPSRIKAARQLRDLIATDMLERLSPSTVADSELSVQVGKNLALLISEAEAVRDSDGNQRIVVRPSPVYRVTSLMEEEADLTAHATVLSSCQAIVDKLQQKGRITTREEQKARAYFRFHEKPWANQPQIADGATLYLDDLAVDYFLRLGMLDKLKAAGFTPIISSEKVSEANQLISYERISDKAKDAIEHIRAAVNKRIESGKIKVGRQIYPDQPKEQAIAGHPTAGVFDLAGHCDAIILDDRCFNQHVHIRGRNANDDGDAHAPVFTTLDIIDALVAANSITPEERMEYRTQLRQAGYFFIPVSEDELVHHLNASRVENGKVMETAELKAIRENILHVRMNTWLQLPKEGPWLVELYRTFVQVLKDLWKTKADFSDVRARSDWIVDQVDMRGWAHSFGKENGTDIAKTGRSTYIAYIMEVLIPPADVPQEVTDEYWNWVEESILAPIKEQYPDLYFELVEWHRKWIAKVANRDQTEKGGRGDD